MGHAIARAMNQPKVRAMIGVLTTVFLVAFGLLFIASERTTLGGVLVALGVLRAGVAFNQIAAARRD